MNEKEKKIFEELWRIAYIIDKGSADNKAQHNEYLERFYYLMYALLGDSWYNFKEDFRETIIQQAIKERDKGMQEIKIYSDFLDIWFGKKYIKCPECGGEVTNLITEELEEHECYDCDKKYNIHVKYFIEKK